jgi:curved DNA-binding protein CbpA
MTDPYKVLGVRASATDAEVRKAYRRLAQLHHPDHNHGSVESARKFEEVQEAYAQITKLRASAPGRSAGAAGSAGATDPGLEERLRRMEDELLRKARAAQEQARREAREAARAAAASRASSSGGSSSGGSSSEGSSGGARRDPRRPTDEELGYITTTDTIGKILADAREELFGKVEEVRHHPATARVADLIDDMAAKLRGDEKP